MRQDLVGFSRGEAKTTKGGMIFRCAVLAVAGMFVVSAASAAEVDGAVMTMVAPAVFSLHNSSSTRPSPGFGFGAFVETRVTDDGIDGMMYGGAIDALIFTVIDLDNVDLAYRQVDAMARIGAFHRASPVAELYGYFQAGWSIIVKDGENADGPVFVLGGGIRFDLSKVAFVLVDVGFRVGIQTVEGGRVYGMMAPHLALGIGANF